MKKLLACASALFITCLSLSAQHSAEDAGKKLEGQTAFFAELGGPGILFSANIDRRFKKSILGWGGRVGIGFVSLYEDNFVSTPGGGYYTNGKQVSVVTFPLQVNYIFGKDASPHSFEVGAGVTFAWKKLDVFDFYNERKTSVFGTTSFMYRRQPLNGGFSWRAGFTPLIAKGYIQPFGGVSVGYNF